MVVRIISAFVALPLFFVLIYLLPPICLPFAISVVSVVAVYELLWRSNIMRKKSLICVSYIFAALIPLMIYFKTASICFYSALFLFVLLLFAFWLLWQKDIAFKDIAMSFFATVVIPAFFSSVTSIFSMPNGKLLVLMPFIAAWITDTGAYFSGVFLGKHKLAPEISPKKTVEGAIGGIIVCIIAFVIYGMIMKVSVEALIPMILCGLFLSVISQVGDLSMSLIKREYNIKDYGVIFPGHGGILDRFDSVLFTAPASYILLELMRVFNVI